MTTAIFLVRAKNVRQRNRRNKCVRKTFFRCRCSLSCRCMSQECWDMPHPDDVGTLCIRPAPNGQTRVVWPYSRWRRWPRCVIQQDGTITWLSNRLKQWKHEINLFLFYLCSVVAPTTSQINQTAGTTLLSFACRCDCRWRMIVISPFRLRFGMAPKVTSQWRTTRLIHSPMCDFGSTSTHSPHIPNW